MTFCVRLTQPLDNGARLQWDPDDVDRVVTGPEDTGIALAEAKALLSEAQMVALEKRTRDLAARFEGLRGERDAALERAAALDGRLDDARQPDAASARSADTAERKALLLGAHVERLEGALRRAVCLGLAFGIVVIFYVLMREGLNLPVPRGLLF